MIRLALFPQAALALAAIVTYLIHSTLWFLIAWAATRPRLGLPAAGRALIWRAALVGPLLSGALALAVSDGWRASAVHLTLRPLPAAVTHPPSPGRPALSPLSDHG